MCNLFSVKGSQQFIFHCIFQCFLVIYLKKYNSNYVASTFPGTMGHKDEEVRYLHLALEIDPKLEHALVNLAGFYQVGSVV